MKPVFLRSSGVLKAYITDKKMRLDKMEYSISLVAVKAMSMRDTKRNTLLSKSDMRFLGILNAFPENKP